MFELSKRELVSEAENNALSANGGDYHYYEETIMDNDGNIVITLHSTSGEFDFCEVSGKFTDTVTIYLTDVGWYRDKPLPVRLQRWYYGLSDGDELTVEQLVKKVHG